MRSQLAALLAVIVAAQSCLGPGSSLLDAPLDERIELSFEGNSSFSSERLTAVVAPELERSKSELPDKAAADDAAYEIQLFYLKSGYPDVRVDYEYEGGKSSVRMRFRVSEGARVALGKIDVKGNKAFDDETLIGLFTIEDQRYFVESEMRSGAGSIRRFYAEQGYLRASVGDPSFMITDGVASVSIKVEEGPRFTVREVTFEGASEDVADELSRLQRGLVGQTYTPRIAFETRAQVLDLHLRHAHPDCQVEFQSRLDEANGDVRLHYTVEPGERVTIAGIRIEGNTDTAEGLIRKRIPVESGDPYDEGKIRAGFQDLFKTGLFQSIRFHLAEESGSERTLVVDVVEAPSLEFYFEPGWGSYEGPRVRLGVEELNTFGSGLRLGLETTLSRLAQGVKVGLTDPWFLGSSVVAETSLFTKRRQEPSFTTSEAGVGLNFRRQWSRHLSTAVGYTYRQTRLSDVDVTATLPPQALEDNDIASVVSSLVWSDRDSVLTPTRGTRQSYQLEWASALLGSQIDYLKGSAEVSPIFPLRDGTLLAGSFRTSVIVPLVDTDAIPLQERLFNGGENTVRSFEEDQLGPKDATGEPIGGEANTILSLELRQRVFKNVSVALFYDLGNVVPLAQDYFRLDDFRSGVGVGLRYLLPIGPLRVDLAFNPNRRDGEDEYVLHFAVGLPY